MGYKNWFSVWPKIWFLELSPQQKILSVVVVPHVLYLPVVTDSNAWFVILKDTKGKFIKDSKKLEDTKLVDIQFYNELIKADIKIKKWKKQEHY